MTQTRQFEAFETWVQIHDHIKAGYALYYHAPLDRNPVMVGGVVRRDGKIRVIVQSRDADDFTADSSHLDRFRRLVGRRVRG